MRFMRAVAARLRARAARIEAGAGFAPLLTGPGLTTLGIVVLPWSFTRRESA